MRAPENKSSSFSLIELLVAMGIGVMLIVFLTTIAELVRKSLQSNRENADATSQVRFIFNFIDRDLKNMPRRMDMGYQMTNSPVGTDFLRFVSQIQGPGGDRHLSLVGYQILKESSGSYGLYRGVRGYNWSDVGFMGLDDKLSPPDLMQLPGAISLDRNAYEVLSPGVFKVELAFQYKNSGKLFRDPPHIVNATNIQNGTILITNLASIVVGVAIVGGKGQKMMTPELYESLPRKLGEVPEGITPLSHWSTNLYKKYPEFQQGVPKPVAESVHIYQRFYPME